MNPITGVQVKLLDRYFDSRGWLAEVFRNDECRIKPEMCYVSVTLPGITRGPHEHHEQSDLFCFFSSSFKVKLWDNRPDSFTFGRDWTIYAGEDIPTVILVPPGVIHAYQNVGDDPGIVINCPDRLYAGHGRADPVDEIRHEGSPEFALH